MCNPLNLPGKGDPRAKRFLSAAEDIAAQIKAMKTFSVMTTLFFFAAMTCFPYSGAEGTVDADLHRKNKADLETLGSIRSTSSSRRLLTARTLKSIIAANSSDESGWNGGGVLSTAEQNEGRTPENIHRLFLSKPWTKHFRTAPDQPCRRSRSERGRRRGASNGSFAGKRSGRTCNRYARSNGNIPFLSSDDSRRTWCL